MTLFFTAMLIGFVAAGVASIIRAVVPTLWLLQKPFSCDLCMSWWSSLGTTIVLSPETPVHVCLAAMTVSILVLKTIGRLSDIGVAPPLE